jgi:hypothetical protein
MSALYLDVSAQELLTTFELAGEAGKTGWLPFARFVFCCPVSLYRSVSDDNGAV